MDRTIKIIRRLIIFFMIVLFLSGLTAIPLERELTFLSRCFSPANMIGAWIEKVYLGIVHTNKQYPFLAYGYDWLAFAHFVLAILFIGPLKDPVRNKLGDRIWHDRLFTHYSLCLHSRTFSGYSCWMAID